METHMAPPGHRPVTNSDRRVESGKLVLESAAPVLTSKQSLPYYKPVVRELARGEALGSLVKEFALDGPKAAPIVDVAVASFGSSAAHVSTEVLEAVIGADDR